MHSLIPEFKVNDVVATATFYSDVLGFTTVSHIYDSGGERVVLRQGSLEIIFRSTKAGRISQAAALHIIVEDIFALHQRLKGRVLLERPLVQTFFSVGEFSIYDNDGMLLRFVQPTSQAYERSPSPQTRAEA